MEVLSQPILSAVPSQCRQELVERLGILRRNESFCDVKVIVTDKEFNAHKVVLAAASPFFLALLASDMRESNEQLIKIELEEATAPVMEDVLQYVYTGNVSVTEESAHNLIATADYFLLPGLKTMASNFLKENTTIENCIFNYYFADKFQCVELREEARKIINSDFTAVMQTEDFLSLDMKQVMEWVSSDDVTVDAEEEVFKGIVKWVSYNRSEREDEFPSLLCQVRLVSISHDFLLNELVKEELVANNTELCSNFVLEAMRVMVSATDREIIQQPRKCLETHRDGIFVCGGKRSLCYFPHQNTWYQLSNMAFYHDCNHAPAQCKGRVYIACSESDKLGESNLMEFYIPATNSWGAVQLADTVTFTCSTAVLKGYLYATCNEFNLRRGLYRYDPDKNYCEKLKAPPTTQRNTCIVSDEQYLYMIGGASYARTTERFDPNANEWEQVAPINEARHTAFGAAMNGKVYIAGGQWKNKVISSCEVYNPLTNEWHLMPSLKVPRMSGSMVCHKGKLYVLGGFDYCVPRRGHKWSQKRVLSVEIFDCEKNEWKEKSVIPAKCFETAEEEEEKNIFRACYARLCKVVIDNLKPLN